MRVLVAALAVTLLLRCDTSSLPLSATSFACGADVQCGNGYRCVSSRCRESSTCQATERCTDGEDNDCNGLVDCDDSACRCSTADDAGQRDGGFDAGAIDAGADAGAPDAGTPDAGLDAGSPDAGSDAGCAQGWCPQPAATDGLNFSSICSLGATCRAVVERVPTGGDGGSLRLFDVGVDASVVRHDYTLNAVVQGELRVSGCTRWGSVTWHAAWPVTPTTVDVGAGNVGFGYVNVAPVPVADLPISSLEHFWFHADAGFVTRTFGPPLGSGGALTPFTSGASNEQLLTGASAGTNNHLFFGTHGYTVRTVYRPVLLLLDGGFSAACDGGCNGGLDALADMPRLGTRDLLASTAVDLRNGGRQIVVVGRRALFVLSSDGGIREDPPPADLDYTALWVSSTGATWVVGQSPDGGASEVWITNSSTGWQRVFTSPTPVRGVAGVETDAGTTVWLVGNSGLFVRRTFP